jgi:nucleotide-binding universal stress UspA family protein
MTTAMQPDQMMDGTASTTPAGAVVVAAGGRAIPTTVRAGATVARRLGRELDIVSVIEPLPRGIWDGDGAPYGTFGQERAAAARADLARVLRPLGDDVRWPVEILTGHVARTLGEVVQARNATLLVVGIGRRRPVDRLLGGETALRTIRACDCPVLAVAPTFETAFSAAAVGIDFSEASNAAARLAARLIEPAGTLHLVHVWQPTGSEEDTRYPRHLADRFRRCIAALSLPASVRVATHVREGGYAERLTDFAEAHRVDFIAVGRTGHGLLHRLLVGSVTERVLRSAACSVLVVPADWHGEPDSDSAGDASTIEVVELPAWAAQLDAFARRNAGRVVALEVTDPEYGISSEESGYILFGTSLVGDRTIHIVLGETNGRREHLTRTIAGAWRLVVGRDAEGAERWLRIERGRSQTVLRLVPVETQTSAARATQPTEAAR